MATEPQNKALGRRKASDFTVTRSCECHEFCNSNYVITKGHHTSIRKTNPHTRRYPDHNRTNMQTLYGVTFFFFFFFFFCTSSKTCMHMRGGSSLCQVSACHRSPRFDSPEHRQPGSPHFQETCLGPGVQSLGQPFLCLAQCHRNGACGSQCTWTCLSACQSLAQLHCCPTKIK